MLAAVAQIVNDCSHHKTLNANISVIIKVLPKNFFLITENIIYKLKKNGKIRCLYDREHNSLLIGQYYNYYIFFFIEKA